MENSNVLKLNKRISTLSRIYRPAEVMDADIDEVLEAIRSGWWNGEDVRAAVAELRMMTDSGRMNERKRNALPVALYNGTFSYRNCDSLTSYSSYTALDFDSIDSPDELEALRHRLANIPYVYALFETPSGRGLKAIVQHDSPNPEHHGELYAQLLKIFSLNSTDSSVRDLARGNYICHDPRLWKNDACQSFHFVHDPLIVSSYPSRSRNCGTSSLNIEGIRIEQSQKTVVGEKSDRSIIAMLNSRWTKDETRWMEGNRANSVFASACELCRAGVDVDAALEYLKNAYTRTGLNREEITYHALRGYQCNMEAFGCNRKKFDSYGRQKIRSA